MNTIRSIANSVFIIVAFFLQTCFCQEAPLPVAGKIKTDEPLQAAKPTDSTVVSVQEKVSIFHNIVIGSTLPLAKEGKLLEQGMDIVFRTINKQGGVNNKIIRLLTLNDSKDISLALKNVDELVKKTPFLLNLFTVGVVKELLPRIKEGKILVFGPEENSDVLYSPEYTNIIHTKPALSFELEALIKYAYTTLRKRRFALFYTNDEYGLAGSKRARSILKKYNMVPVAQGTYPAGTVEVEDAIKEISEGHPDAVICISRRHATYNFVLHAVNKGLTQTIFLGTSYLLPLQGMLKSARGINFITTSTTPNPMISRLEIVDEYRKAMREYFPHQFLSTISLFSYINASIFIEILQRIKGIPTPEKVVNVVQDLKDYKFKGLVLDFNPGNRTLIANLWISPGHREQWIEVK